MYHAALSNYFLKEWLTPIYTIRNRAADKDEVQRERKFREVASFERSKSRESAYRAEHKRNRRFRLRMPPCFYERGETRGKIGSTNAK